MIARLGTWQLCSYGRAVQPNSQNYEQIKDVWSVHNGVYCNAILFGEGQDK